MNLIHGALLLPTAFLLNMAHIVWEARGGKMGQEADPSPPAMLDRKCGEVEESCMVDSVVRRPSCRDSLSDDGVRRVLRREVVEHVFLFPPLRVSVGRPPPVARDVSRCL